MAERCLRTALISPIAAPERSSAPVTACLSASAIPGAGKVSSAEPPPGDEAEREIVRSQSLGHGEDARRGLAAAGIRHRMRRLDHLDRPRRHAVAVPGDDEAFEGTLPMIFDGPRHRRCRLAGAHHDGAAGGRLRQVRRQAARRPGTRKGCVQQAAKNVSRIFAHASPCQSRTPASSAAPAPAGAAQALQGATGYHAAPAVTHRHGSGDTGARP